jgi:hypothetical protein
MKVREAVAPEQRFAIGLRLGADAARELADPRELYEFRKWLDQKNAYVFTINGFPYGNFMAHESKNRFTDPTGPLTSDWIIPCCSSLFSKNYWNQARKAVSVPYPARLRNSCPIRKSPIPFCKKWMPVPWKLKSLAGPKNLDLHLGHGTGTLGSV